MDYRITIPLKGFTAFELWRDPSDDLIEVFLSVDGAPRSSYELTVTEIETWLRHVIPGDHPRYAQMREDVVRTVWNFPRVCYDITEHRLTTPDDQRHPDEIAADRGDSAPGDLPMTPLDWRDFARRGN